MKKILFVSVIIIASLTACNEDYNEQFNINYQVTDVKNSIDTLSATDYGSIADNAANVLIATEKDPVGQVFLKALADVKTNKYFTNEAPAEEYIPAFLNSKFPNADIGSKFVITFNQYLEPSTYMPDFDNISDYTLSESDYQGIWGDNIVASFLSPLSISKIPSMLNKNVKNPQEGDMLVVNYAYSDVEPSSGGSTESFDKISDVVADKTGANYKVKGQVIATYARGFLINDGTASILVYLNATPNYSLGDVVAVSGTTSAYSGLMQFSASSEVTFIERNSTFAYPSSPTLLSGEAAEQYIISPSVKYVSLQGNLSKSGSNYNLTIDGTSCKCRISFPASGIIDDALTGMNVDVTGYLIGSYSSTIYIMVTSIVETGKTTDIKPVGVVALSSAGNYTISGVVAATYARGFLVTDGTGNILVYLNKAHDYKIGDLVNVSGTTSKYAGLMQFSSSSVITKGDNISFKQPVARKLEADDMKTYISTPYCAYVNYTGTLKISGNYYNVIIDGMSDVIGSLSYPLTDAVDASLDGKKVNITGYAIGVSSGKYLNTMLTSISEASTTRSAMIGSRATTITANTSTLYKYTNSQWKPYTNSDVKIGVVTRDVYSSIGSEMIASPESVIPAYLYRTFPYAVEGDKCVVVYKDKSKNYIAKEYKFITSWTALTEYEQTSLTFTKDATGISANMSTYIDETFLGDDGGFITKDITLGSLTYVWTNTSSYGWKASAYMNNTNNTSDSYLISPTINFTKAIAPVMTFDEAHKYLNGAEPTTYFSVLISTDYKGDPSACNWHVLPVENWSDGTSWDFVNVGVIDLSAYIGGYANIAFRYTSDATAAATWEIKNLKVVEKESAQ